MGQIFGFFLGQIYLDIHSWYFDHAKYIRIFIRPISIVTNIFWYLFVQKKDICLTLSKTILQSSNWGTNYLFLFWNGWPTKKERDMRGATFFIDKIWDRDQDFDTNLVLTNMPGLGTEQVTCVWYLIIFIFHTTPFY